MNHFGRFLLSATVLLAVSTLIGVACLRAAIALYNRIAGGATPGAAVPVPTFEKAALANFLTLALQFIGQGIVGQLIHTGTMAVGARWKFIDVLESVAIRSISFPVSLLALALILTAILPTTFGRAVVVSLFYMMVVTAIVVIFIVIVVAL